MRPHLRSELVRRASRRYARARLADRRLPVSDDFGFDRGVPIDRHYIARFLSRFACAPGYAAGDIRGRVLEIGGREYVDRFGVPNERPGSGLVHQVDVLHESTINAEATIVGDLASPQTLPVDTFNCIWLRNAVRTRNARDVLRAARALRRDGIVHDAQFAAPAWIEAARHGAIVPSVDCEPGGGVLRTGARLTVLGG